MIASFLYCLNNFPNSGGAKDRASIRMGLVFGLLDTNPNVLHFVGSPRPLVPKFGTRPVPDMSLDINGVFR